jgi:methylated-DNA-[protein]-cysteine S-methyltransferase
MRMHADTAVREHYCLFETAIGPCGIAWTDDGLTRLQLPESSRDATERRLQKRAGNTGPGLPPPPIRRAITDLQSYMIGDRVDFAAVPIDWTGVSPFHLRIYEATRALGWGETASYGEIARRAGPPVVARAVGQAMSRNPVPVIMPCHRVLAAGRKIGGFSAHGGAVTKERLLALEGVRLAAEEPVLPGLFPAPQRWD